MCMRIVTRLSIVFDILTQVSSNKLFQVQSIQEEAAKLIVAYSGEKARDIQQHEAEVVNAWRNLQIRLDQRKNKLSDSSDLYRFFGMVRDLLNWISDMIRQMTNQDKPR